MLYTIHIAKIKKNCNFDSCREYKMLNNVVLINSFGLKLRKWDYF
jgi:hypothetical protein